MSGILQQPRTHDWHTPKELFDPLNEEFGFALDVAASAANALCRDFYDTYTDGLRMEWPVIGAVWCNPPYGYEIPNWVRKCYEQSQRGLTVVMLIPARTDTAWWHDYVMRSAEVRLIRGRLRFGGGNRVLGHNAPFPSAIVVFQPGAYSPVFSAISRSAELQAVS